MEAVTPLLPAVTQFIPVFYLIGTFAPGESLRLDITNYHKHKALPGDSVWDSKAVFGRCSNK